MIGLKELAKKKGKVVDEKVNCRRSKVLFGGLYQSSTMTRGSYLYPHATKVLADYGKVQFLTKRLSMINKDTTFQPDHVQDMTNPIFSLTVGTPNRQRIMADPSWHTHHRSLNWHSFPFNLSFDACQKMASTHAPQFRSEISLLLRNSLQLRSLSPNGHLKKRSMPFLVSSADGKLTQNPSL